MLLEIDPKAFQAACKILQEADLDAAAAPPACADAGGVRRVRPGDAAGAQQGDRREGAGARYVELPGCGHCPPLEQPRRSGGDQGFRRAAADARGLRALARRIEAEFTALAAILAILVEHTVHVNGSAR